MVDYISVGFLSVAILYVGICVVFIVYEGKLLLSLTVPVAVTQQLQSHSLCVTHCSMHVPTHTAVGVLWCTL